MAFTPTNNFNGTKGSLHVQTRFKDIATGKSLHPLQRVGLAAKTTIPVQRVQTGAGGGIGGGIGGNAPAARNSLTTPPVMTVGSRATNSNSPKIG